ncbi:Asp-tRNA(Asn)/Glu-tRNA(Gln) amidotransferase subunit GatC [Candidatus Uhrbacteria bacterium]|nr:Asp-tRNA(Asn)/Glu-tRNA(Gln) amidotransferase subunit GatC [Candidatus Uhrbacteria bacterium]
MSITCEEVQKLAELARLELTEEEIKKTETDLDAILGYVQRLAQIDTTDSKPTAAEAMSEGWREDEAIPCDDRTRELIYSNFPARKGNLLHTPGVFSAPKK